MTIDLGYCRNGGTQLSTAWAPGDAKPYIQRVAAELAATLRWYATDPRPSMCAAIDDITHGGLHTANERDLDKFEVTWLGAVITTGSCPRRSAVWRAALGLKRSDLPATHMARLIAEKTISLAQTAGRHGGFWVSGAGGTANVIAGEIARATGIPFKTACAVLNEVGTAALGVPWYNELAFVAGSHPNQDPDWEAFRFDARMIARTAIRALRDD